MNIIECRFQEVIDQQKKSTWRELVIFSERELEVLKQFCSLFIAWRNSSDIVSFFAMLYHAGPSS